MTDSHPYDQPWAIVKDLRAQIHDLRAAFQAEQQQRAAEVTELRNEVAVLKDALNKEKHERQVQCHNLTNDLTVTNSGWQKAVDELKVQHRQQIGQLNQMLQDEVRDRKAAESLRETREASIKADIQTNKETIQTEIGHHKQEHNRTKDEHATRINALIHDLGVIVEYLQKIGGSYDIMKGAVLRSSNKVIGNPSGDKSSLNGYQN
mmetsp:Transcript_58500/g.148284  ORF Transcript_58500/g.148284 Transcript_58500/m.148284 type:complete len:206 (-) Transcript_58500:207-824(-)